MARLRAGEPPRVAWPVATIRVPAGRGSADTVHGFLMPDMRRWFRPLSLLLQPGPRAAEFPSATWDSSLAAAESLARLVADLHDAHYVVGDLKPGNLWVNDQGNVGMSDVDSFQFSDDSGTFPCLSRTPDYTAPECLGDGTARPGSLSDDFVLAVVIYQLLMDGMHPFAGIPADGTRYMSIDDNVIHGRAQVAFPGVVLPMPGAPPLSALPRRLRDLFAACFRDTAAGGLAARPTAPDWAAALAAERAAGRLRICQINPLHEYTAERPWCPWCDAESR
jgi:DNA-binding helix-hairpin-helix protein with protein kinase domain